MRRLLSCLGIIVLIALPAVPTAAAEGPSTAVEEQAACQAPPSVVRGPLDGRVIVIDPGHGVYNGTTTGADGVNGAHEDDNALDIGCRVLYLLSSEGAHVYITRGIYDPGAPPVGGLIARVAFAESHQADVFVSIHQNDGSATDRGVSTYYTRGDSQTLAADIQDEMVATTGLRDDGVQTARFYVTKNTTMPAVLVEGGFLSNPSEAARITTPSFHETEAEALNRGLLAYFGKGLGLPKAPAADPAPDPAPAAAPAQQPAVSAPSGGRVLSMVATAYGPSLQDNYPYGPVDAFGNPLVAGDVAVDPSVIPLGTKLYVTGYDSPYLPAGGFYAVARDTGGAIKGDRIDLFINGTPAQVASFGIQNVTVTVLN